MARATAEIKRERTVSTLVDNLFLFSGASAKAEKQRATEALLRENPQLRDRSNMRTGMRIIVPTGLGLRTTDRVSRADVNLPGLIDDGGARIAAAESAIARGFERREKERAEATQRLGQRTFAAALRAQVPNGTERLTTVRRRLAEEEASEAEARDALAKALATASEQMKKLRALADEPSK